MMQQFQYPTILLVFLSLLITSCGGESVPEVVTPNEIDGLWSGSVNDNVGIAQTIYLGLSDSEGNLNIILDSSGNASLAGLAFFFNGEVDSISSELTLYDASGDLVDNLEFVEGSFTSDPFPSLNATLTSNTTSRELTLILNYNAVLYEGPSSLALVSGTWRFDDGLNTLDLEIDVDGVITGDDSDGCQYSGTIGTLNSNFNLYQISVDITCPTDPTISTTGLATLAEILAQETLIYSITGIDTTKSAPVAFVERLIKQ